jgi:hypothetical protein
VGTDPQGSYETSRTQGDQPSRLAYFEWSAPDDAEHDDPEAWAQANPALGIRITEDFVRGERVALRMASGSDEDFARERLGIFPEDIDATETVIDEADWKLCGNRDSKLTGPLVLALEVSADRKRTVIASAGRSTITGTHVEVIENRAGTGWAVQRLIELRDKHKPTAIVANFSGPAGGLKQDCQRERLEVTDIKGTEYAQACQAALDAITEHRWRHIAQASLTAAATGAGKRPTGDAWVFDRRGVLDISALTAVVLAAWTVGTGDGPSTYEDRGLLVL